jgi:hypothetical protein
MSTISDTTHFPAKTDHAPVQRLQGSKRRTAMEDYRKAASKAKKQWRKERQEQKKSKKQKELVDEERQRDREKCVFAVLCFWCSLFFFRCLQSRGSVRLLFDR